MTKCISCNGSTEDGTSCGRGHRTNYVRGVGVVSVSSLDGGEIECRHFVPWVDFGIVSKETASYAEVKRYRQLARKRRSRVFHPSICVVCGYRVCRCADRLTRRLSNDETNTGPHSRTV